MVKYPKTIRPILSRDHLWVYQEIITEALVVLWFALQIAFKLGTRFFPEWRNTRVDPDAQTDFDDLLAKLGYPMSGCMWDDLVFTWMPLGLDTVGDSAVVPFPVDGEHRRRLGYVAVIAIVCTTAILTASVGCSLIVNRNWKYPKWTQHIFRCQRISTLFTGSLFELPTWFSSICLGVALGVGLLVFPLAWLLLWALPVVLVSGAAAWLVIYTIGPATVFPCSVLCVCVLCIYCTGRIWGFWMNETYFGWINKKLRRMCGMTLVVDASIVQPVPLAAAEIKGQPMEKVKRALFQRVCLFPVKWATLSLLLMASSKAVDPLESAMPSTDGWGHGWERWRQHFRNHINHSIAETYCTIYETGMAHSHAMLSYWMDLGYPRWNTSHPGLLSLFTTSHSPLTDALLQKWIWVLPLMIMVAPIPSSIIAMVNLCTLQLSGEDRDQSSVSIIDETPSDPNEKPQEASGIGTDCIRMTDMDAACSASATTVLVEDSPSNPGKHDGCSCSGFAGIIAGLAIAIRRGLSWYFLPLPLVQLVVPEALQVWALLLLLTVFGAWMSWKLLQEALKLWKEMRAPTPSIGSQWWMSTIIS
ncbi:uncharacterized protein LOC129596316 [Paramacrobiotus metropolitanus]|uniref:uncharacterized protein LOC129596316 n=1 Tax=Paramacrobiotus metropolitanus TaxID=2943436 RepID=UPI0024459FBB|nr:uncharacterized protein LOC129596316 [Paramacrobiotus metropolitanus]